ncbi:MAG: hypothetical protein K8S16_09005 [Bacteroidales bacterium]|nr:hypothetical protein [Bacteroidales bacterium]
MKTIISTLIFMSIISFTYTQSIERDVIANSGDYYEGTNVSLSWTVGEIATETYANGSYILTQGFQQPIGIIITGIDLDVIAFLEGPFSGTQMTTMLNTAGLIPLSQPFYIQPWQYAGSENVTSIPNANIVDWVLIELRDTTDAASANSTSVIARQAAFLTNNGTVVGLDGSSILSFDNSITHNLFVVVWHRNHLGIMSANAVTQSGGIYIYDFSNGAGQAYGETDAQKYFDNGIWGMIAGDGNADGVINLNDKINVWSQQVGTTGYKTADYNMEGQVNNQDKNDLMIPNYGNTEQIPD